MVLRGCQADSPHPHQHACLPAHIASPMQIAIAGPPMVGCALAGAGPAGTGAEADTAAVLGRAVFCAAPWQVSRRCAGPADDSPPSAWVPTCAPAARSQQPMSAYMPAKRSKHVAHTAKQASGQRCHLVIMAATDQIAPPALQAGCHVLCEGPVTQQLLLPRSHARPRPSALQGCEAGLQLLLTCVHTLPAAS